MDSNEETAGMAAAGLGIRKVLGPRLYRPENDDARLPFEELGKVIARIIANIVGERRASR